MIFSCSRCQTRYKLPDEKVANRVLKVRCKNCSVVIVVRDPALSRRPPGAEAPAPAGQDEAWFVALGGRQHGPISRSAVMGLVGSGDLHALSYVWRQGMAEWVRLHDVPELSGLPGSTAEADYGIPDDPHVRPLTAVITRSGTTNNAPAGVVAAAAHAAEQERAAAQAAASKGAARPFTVEQGGGQPSTSEGPRRRPTLVPRMEDILPPDELAGANAAQASAAEAAAAAEAEARAAAAAAEAAAAEAAAKAEAEAKAASEAAEAAAAEAAARAEAEAAEAAAAEAAAKAEAEAAEAAAKAEAEAAAAEAAAKAEAETAEAAAAEAAAKAEAEAAEAAAAEAAAKAEAEAAEAAAAEAAAKAEAEAAEALAKAEAEAAEALSKAEAEAAEALAKAEAEVAEAAAAEALAKAEAGVERPSTPDLPGLPPLPGEPSSVVEVESIELLDDVDPSPLVESGMPELPPLPDLPGMPGLPGLPTDATPELPVSPEISESPEIPESADADDAAWADLSDSGAGADAALDDLPAIDTADVLPRVEPLGDGDLFAAYGSPGTAALAAREAEAEEAPHSAAPTAEDKRMLKEALRAADVVLPTHIAPPTKQEMRELHQEFSVVAQLHSAKKRRGVKFALLAALIIASLVAGTMLWLEKRDARRLANAQDARSGSKAIPVAEYNAAYDVKRPVKEPKDQAPRPLTDDEKAAIAAAAAERDETAPTGLSRPHGAAPSERAADPPEPRPAVRNSNSAAERAGNAEERFAKLSAEEFAALTADSGGKAEVKIEVGTTAIRPTEAPKTAPSADERAEKVATAFGRKRRQLARCKSGTEEKIKTQFTVSPSGRVTSVSISGTSSSQKAQCVKGILEQAIFPPGPDTQTFGMPVVL
ncbi:MAG: GYF domain-containing protein [Myxococcota bacterium]